MKLSKKYPEIWGCLPADDPKEEEITEEVAQLEEENELFKLLVTGRVKGDWPDGMNGDPDDWEEWSLQLYGHEAGDLLLGQEAWDHIVRGLKRDALLTE